MFERFFKKNICETSAQKAKKRLQFALVYDRIQVSETMLNDLNRDILEVISRYFIIDKNNCRLDVNDNDNSMAALVVNIPIVAAKHKSPGTN